MLSGLTQCRSPEAAMTETEDATGSVRLIDGKNYHSMRGGRPVLIVNTLLSADTPRNTASRSAVAALAIVGSLCSGALE
jgi:hypothetical protein